MKKSISIDKWSPKLSQIMMIEKDRGCVVVI